MKSKPVESPVIDTFSSLVRIVPLAGKLDFVDQLKNKAVSIAQ